MFEWFIELRGFIELNEKKYQVGLDWEWMTVNELNDFKYLQNAWRTVADDHFKNTRKSDSFEAKLGVLHSAVLSWSSWTTNKQR